MDLEERHLLPRLLGEAARMARTLVAEHTHLRARMIDLGHSSASPIARRGELSRFLEELCAHERHEESAIYPWADDHLDGIDRDALLAT
jgi:hypothetical protein